MSLCINPRCLQPDHPRNDSSRFCESCGSELILKQRYRVLRLLSDKSGFGKVYEAYERSTPKILKVLKDNHSHNQKAVELFQQEAEVLSQLHHPGIPLIEPHAYFQFLPKDGIEVLHCIIMEKIDGPNLKEWMKQQGNNPISEKQALNWLKQLTKVLHRVHQKNYFHRDIKPENIMIRSSGQLVLIDFGAAREMTYTYLAQLGGGASGVTRISSAGYTPPEQEYGQAVPQSDFYALGRTFIYLLTGKLPTDSGIYNSLNNEFTWRDHAPHISPQLTALMDKLIAPRAADRPKNTQELLDRVIQCSRELSQPQPPATSTPPVLSTVVNHSTFSPATPSQPIVHCKNRFKKQWMVGGVAALILGLGGLGIWQYNRYASPASVMEEIAIAKTLTGHSGEVKSLIVGPGGKNLISGSVDTTIKIWDISTGKATRTLTGHTSYINTLVISPDGRSLVSGSADKTIRVWDLATGRTSRVLKDSSFVNALAFSPNGELLVSGNADSTLKVWDFATGKQLHVLTGHTSPVNSLAFNPDGHTLVSGSADTTIKIWDLKTEKVLHTLTGHGSYVNTVIVSPDGKTIISASADNTIKIWDLKTGELIRTLTGHTSYVNALTISPDGKTLLSGSADETIRIWNLETGHSIRTLAGYGNPINYFVIDADWQFIATGSKSKDIKIWRFQ